MKILIPSGTGFGADRDSTMGERGLDVSTGEGWRIHFENEDDAEAMAWEILWRLGKVEERGGPRRD